VLAAGRGRDGGTNEAAVRFLDQQPCAAVRHSQFFADDVMEPVSPIASRSATLPGPIQLRVRCSESRIVKSDLGFHRASSLMHSRRFAGRTTLP
jgi:hypothetical protein